MQKLLLSLTLLSAALLLPPSSRAQFIVVGQACGAGGLTGISTNGTPVVCQGNPLVWTAVSGGSGSGSSNLGAALNVKLAPYNAVGNGKFFVDGVTNAGNNQLTSATATFTSSDNGQSVYCMVGAAFWAAGNSTATFVNSSTIIYSGTNAGAHTNLFCTLTNPADPAAITAAFAACKSTFNSPSQGVNFQGPACSVYLPTGVYGIGAGLNNLISSGTESCVGVIGDGMGKSGLIPTQNFTPIAGGGNGSIINDRCASPYLKDFFIEVASNTNAFGAGSPGLIVLNGTFGYLENVAVYDECLTGGTAYGMAVLGGSNIVMIRPTVIASGSCGGVQGGLQINGASQINVYSPFLSNTQANLSIANAPAGNNGAGTVIYGGVIDEGSISTVAASQDVWFNGTTLTGGANCLSVDATSFVWLTGGYCGTFAAGTGGGPTVASGGVLNMTQVHVQANGASSACYTSAAYGGIVDDGTNRCTLVSGGTVYPSGGVVNKTSLSHLPFNAFQSGTLAAGTVQSFAIDQPVAVQSLSWTPSNAFACTAGSFPTLSITDGTVTLTTAATDTATNGAVTHTFANTTASILNSTGTVGTVLQVKVVTTGTCGTAPTNVNINVWGQATAPGV